MSDGMKRIYIKILRDKQILHLCRIEENKVIICLREQNRYYPYYYTLPYNI